MDLEKKIENIANAIRIANNEIKTMSLWRMPENIEKIEGMPSAYIVERLANEIELASFNTITNIGDYAFYNYANLENISFPNSVETIGTQVLKGCNNLESVSIPFVGNQKNGNGVDNFGYLFGGTSIYDNGANVPSSLKEVKITGETPIGDGAFYDCKDITEVDLKESLIKDIGILAFYGCTSLENVSLPNTIENVGIGAFYGNDNLNYTIVDGIKYLGNNDNPYLYCEGDRLNLTRTSINIHEGCKIIGAGAFLGCVLSSSLTIPSSVEYIGDYAFRSCSRLSSVSFAGGSKLKRIGRESFRDCKGVLGIGGLTSINIPYNVEFIDRGAFRGCDKLTSITLPFVGRTANPNERHSHFGYIFGANGYGENDNYVPQGLNVVITNAKSIGDYAFRGCSLSGLLLNREIEYIGSGAFPSNEDLFTNYNGVYYICATGSGGAPLVCMGNLSPDGVDYNISGSCKFVYQLRGNSVGDDNIYHLTIPDSVIGISDDILTSMSNSGLPYIAKSTKYTYKPSETAIETYYLGSEENPYLYCLGCEKKDDYNFTDIIIADGCRFIGEQAFIGISNAVIIIPKSVTYIGASAFENATIELLPQQGYTFEDYEFTRIGDYAFYNSQTSDVIADNSPVLKATIKHIGKGAFKYSSRHEDTTLKGTETIGDSAFANFVMPDNFDLSQTNITSLPNYMFADCLNAKAIILPNTLERIGNSAFENVTIKGGVGEISIPKGVVSMGANAFRNCKHRNVYYAGTIDQWATIEFSNASSSPIRHGDQGAGITLWLYSPHNKDYYPLINDVNIDKAYKISDYAFYDYRQIMVVNIPNTVTSIGESAFENTWIDRVYVEENTLFDFSKLALGGLSDYITLDEDVGKIKDYAFFNNALDEFIIPSGCKSIGKKAFNYSSGITQTLKTLYVKAETPPTLSDGAIPSSVTKLSLSPGLLSAYQSAEGWSAYAGIMVEE